MKRIRLSIMAIGLSLAFNPVVLNAENVKPTTFLSAPKIDETEKVKVLLVRLDEINLMDKSHLKFSEKRELRIELRSIRQQLRDSHGGVYISVGAIIIIVLLLIIIL